MVKYIAYCIKGLEEVVKSEITSNIKNAKIIDSGDKRIIFETDENLNDLTSLRTVDDIGFLICEIKEVSSIQQIISELENVDLDTFKDKLKILRDVCNDFSLTASIVGNGKIKPQEVFDQLSKYITEKYNWNYTKLNHTNFDIRIFIDHKTCLISIRLTKESLHHREYKTKSRIGSLRATVAAAMILLATKGGNNKKIVDNFCGSGTILCETLEMNNQVYGGDLEPESVLMTKTNLANLKYNTEAKIKVLNAVNTNWQSNYFDCAISNLPWDKQIKVGSITDLYIGTLNEYKRILKSDGSFCFLVSKPELFIKYLKKIFPDKKIKTIKLGLLGQNPTLIYS